MIGYEHMSGMYFEQDETVVMKYLETLNDGDKILLRDALVNLGVKQIPHITDKVDIIIHKPLYRKVFDNEANRDVVICFEKCEVEYHM